MAAASEHHALARARTGGERRGTATDAARDDDTGEGGKRVRFARILAENSAMHNARRAAASPTERVNAGAAPRYRSQGEERPV